MVKPWVDTPNIINLNTVTRSFKLKCHNNITIRVPCFRHLDETICPALRFEHSNRCLHVQNKIMQIGGIDIMLFIDGFRQYRLCQMDQQIGDDKPAQNIAGVAKF